MDLDRVREHDDPYVAQAEWLVRPGRPDLIDVVADEFERDLRPARREQRTRRAA